MRIIDFHCDTILRLEMSKEAAELRKNDFSIDIEKLKRANSLAQFFALFVYLDKESDPMEKCLKMVDRFYIEIGKNKDAVALAGNYGELMNNDSEGKISAFLTIEEGGAVKGQLHNLRNFYRLGVRLITLLWNFPNEIGYPNCREEYMNLGLTEFGIEMVYEMNRLGMIIDVSHLSDGGFYDVARLSSRPFIASHSNARGVKNHTRNLTDEMISVLADKGGIMGINFEREFLGNESISRVEDMVSHIKYIKNVGGIDVISLGTDYDGINPQLEMSDIGQIGKLIDALGRNNFTDDEIEKICFKNALRVIKDVL